MNVIKHVVQTIDFNKVQYNAENTESYFILSPQECSNYGTFIDSTETNTQPCSWSAVSTRVKQKFIYSVHSPPTNLNPPGPMK